MKLSRDKIQKLLMAAADGQLSPDEEARLRQQVVENREYQTYAEELADIEAALRGALQAKQNLLIKEGPGAIGQVQQRIEQQRKTAVFRQTAWTATRWVLTGLALIFLALWFNNNLRPTPLETIIITRESATQTAVPVLATPTAAVPLTITPILPTSVSENAPTLTPFTIPPTRPPQPTSTPVPLVTVAAIAAEAELFFARGNNLWRASVDGSYEERLTAENQFSWVRDRQGQILQSPLYHLPIAAPDGRTLTWSTAENGPLRLLDITTGEAQTPLTFGSLPADWSPDSRYLAYSHHRFRRDGGDELYIYDRETNLSEHILDLPQDDHWMGILNPVWSPDGQAIAAACCFQTNNSGQLVGDIIRLDAATGNWEIVGTTSAGIGNLPAPICWTADNQITAWEPTAVRCSYRSLNFPAVSPDGRWRAFTLSQPNDTGALSFWLRLENVTDIAASWEYPLDSFQPQHAVWSTDSQMLFLDDTLQGTPIWRLAADGRSPLTMVVADGYLLGVVPAWAGN